MAAIELDREVAASPARVWEIVTDLESSPQHISAIKQVERLDGGDGFGVGTRWRETRTMFGREATEILEVTAVDPGRAYTVEASGRGARYRSNLTVEPAEIGSRLSFTFEASPTGGVARVFAATIGKLFEGATRKALEKDLDDIARAAERSS